MELARAEFSIALKSADSKYITDAFNKLEHALQPWKKAKKDMKDAWMSKAADKLFEKFG